MKSQPSSRAASCRHARCVRRIAGVHSTCALEPLWASFVTAKNSSLPWSTCHSASTPSAAEQRHVGGELGDAPAVGGRVECRTRARRLGQRLDAVDDVGPDDFASGRAPSRGAGRSSMGYRRPGADERGRSSSAGVRHPANLSTMPVATLAPDKFRGILSARRRRLMARGVAAGFDDVRCSRSPMAARARSTRCSPRSAARGAPRFRAARRARRRGVGSPVRRHRGGRGRAGAGSHW
jgi:hypothetical protein